MSPRKQLRCEYISCTRKLMCYLEKENSCKLQPSVIGLSLYMMDANSHYHFPYTLVDCIMFISTCCFHVQFRNRIIFTTNSILGGIVLLTHLQFDNRRNLRTKYLHHYMYIHVTYQLNVFHGYLNDVENHKGKR